MLEIILRYWVVWSLIINVNIILKCLLTTCTSKYFFKIILGGHLVFLLVVARIMYVQIVYDVYIVYIVQIVYIVYIYIYVYTIIYIYIYIHMHIFVNINVYIYIYAVYIVYIYIYTQFMWGFPKWRSPISSKSLDHDLVLKQSW